MFDEQSLCIKHCFPLVCIFSAFTCYHWEGILKNIQKVVEKEYGRSNYQQKKIQTLIWFNFPWLLLGTEKITSEFQKCSHHNFKKVTLFVTGKQITEKTTCNYNRSYNKNVWHLVKDTLLKIQAVVIKKRKLDRI